MTTMTNYYDEETIKNLPIKDIKDLYYSQYDEDKNIPAIDKENDYENEGYLYKLYIYKLENGSTDYQKYLCRIDECWIKCMRCMMYMEKNDYNKDGVWYSCDECLRQENEWCDEEMKGRY